MRLRSSRIPKNGIGIAVAAAITGAWAGFAAAQSAGTSLANTPSAPVIAPKDIVRPAGSKPFASDAAALLRAGVQRHGDTTLAPAGRSCNTCHASADSYNATFIKPWPHFVESVKRKSGLDAISAEGMVQFCMISAMGGRPLPWDSEALAALTAFVLDRHGKVVKP